MPAPCSPSSTGSTGARKRANGVPVDDGMPTARPATTVATARITSGTVIAGRRLVDVVRAPPCDMRGAPKKARNNRRNM